MCCYSAVVDGNDFLIHNRQTHTRSRVNIVIGMKVERIYIEASKKERKIYILYSIYACRIILLCLSLPVFVCAFSRKTKVDQRRKKCVYGDIWRMARQIANRNEWNAVCYYRKKVIYTEKYRALWTHTLTHTHNHAGLESVVKRNSNSLILISYRLIGPKKEKKIFNDKEKWETHEYEH